MDTTISDVNDDDVPSLDVSAPGTFGAAAVLVDADLYICGRHHSCRRQRRQTANEFSIASFTWKRSDSHSTLLPSISEESLWQNVQCRCLSLVVGCLLTVSDSWFK
jgi:hypothetical protein